jgi:hypothetical protein
VLSQFQTMRQMTTFDKSKLDWERDKAIVGDEHELAQARQGKDGYAARTIELLNMRSLVCLPACLSVCCVCL